MKFWLDAHLSPKLADWMRSDLGLDAYALKEIGLRDSGDEEIFQAARVAGAVIITKDLDFINLQERFGPPPSIIWLTCGNTSNDFLRGMFMNHMQSIISLFENGEFTIEISR